MASSSSSPCAACKFLRRKCTAECVFAPYFPPDQPHKFANVHKIFGASNITKLLNELPVHQREDAVNSLAYEAEARVKDPVYGCVGAISVLQRQVAQLQNELNIAHNDLARFNGTMIAVQGNASQGLPSTSLPSLGMNLSGPHSREQQQQLLAREQHYLEIPREPQQLTRDQLRDLARGGSYEAGLAAMGMGTIGSLQPYPRQGSDGQPFPRQGNDGQPFPRQGSDGPFPRQGSDGPFPRQGSDGSSGTGMGGGHIPPP